MTAAPHKVAATIRLVLDGSLALAELDIDGDLTIGVRARRDDAGRVQIIPRQDHTSAGNFPLVLLSGGLLAAAEHAISKAWSARDTSLRAPSYLGREFG